MELRDYQRKAIDWMKDHECGYLAVDMGLGKTRCMLELIRELGVPALVVAPMRVALHTWPSEIKNGFLSYRIKYCMDQIKHCV